MWACYCKLAGDFPRYKCDQRSLLRNLREPPVLEYMDLYFDYGYDCASGGGDDGLNQQVGNFDSNLN